MAINYNALPEHMRDGMRRYIENGIMPGEFLAAVLCNDLIGALQNADDTNIDALPIYGRWLHNEAPVSCYGSAKAVATWMDRGGLRNLIAAE